MSRLRRLWLRYPSLDGHFYLNLEGFYIFHFGMIIHLRVGRGKINFSYTYNQLNMKKPSNIIYLIKEKKFKLYSHLFNIFNWCSIVSRMVLHTSSMLFLCFCIWWLPTCSIFYFFFGFRKYNERHTFYRKKGGWMFFVLS